MGKEEEESEEDFSLVLVGLCLGWWCGVRWFVRINQRKKVEKRVGKPPRKKTPENFEKGRGHGLALREAPTDGRRCRPYEESAEGSVQSSGGLSREGQEELGENNTRGTLEDTVGSVAEGVRWGLISTTSAPLDWASKCREAAG